jgi:hypothetical protein
MRLLLLDYAELANVGNDKVMTLASYCTCIRVEVTGEHKEAVQHCTDFKVRAIRETLTVAQLFKTLRPQHPLRFFIVPLSLCMLRAADWPNTKKNDSFLQFLSNSPFADNPPHRSPLQPTALQTPHGCLYQDLPGCDAMSPCSVVSVESCSSIFMVNICFCSKMQAPDYPENVDLYLRNCTPPHPRRL